MDGNFFLPHEKNYRINNSNDSNYFKILKLGIRF